MTVRHDLIIRQGETWSFDWTKIVAGSPVDLTGYSARMAIRDRVGGSLEALLTTGGATGGTITLGGAAGTVALAMTAAESAALAGSLSDIASVMWGEPVMPAGRVVEFVYDLELISGAGAVTRELEGRCMVDRQVTT